MTEKRRFPRTNDRDLLYMIEVRAKYPAPDYNPHTDGGYNPADFIIDFHLRQSKKKMRKLCRKHALDDSGSKRRLMKRMYLHWRAAKLWKGQTFYGYGKGYEATRVPDCPCGYINVAQWEKNEQKREDLKQMNKRHRAQLRGDRVRRFPREAIMRFPRLPEGFVFRFPR